MKFCHYVMRTEGKVYPLLGMGRRGTNASNTSAKQSNISRSQQLDENNFELSCAVIIMSCSFQLHQ